MIINHNIAALNTHRQLAANTANTNKNIEKLSSGLRINRAGDDAAGLAISEKMRGQIRGLDQASRNAQDGISLIQTAEGALNETHSILQRMRELSVQAGNDTNTGSDRNEIQKEMGQLNSEIDRISSTTEFNTQTLLNGSLGASGTSSAPGNVEITSLSGLKKGAYTVTVGVEATKAATAAGTPAYAADAAVDTAFGATTKDISINGVKIDTTGVDTKAKLLTALNKDKATTGFEASFDGADKLVFTATEFGSGKTLTVGGADTALIGAGALTDGVDATATIADSEGVTTAVTGTGQNVIFGSSELVVKGAAASTSTINVVTTGASIHIGANKDQTMLIDISQMDTKTLGNKDDKIKDVNVLTTSGAEKAIKTLDDAIKQVSGERSKLGAFQNRLEHTINNLGTTSENLTAAESRVRDVDMAKEMMSQTKNNILAQAAQAMLAQANQQPQGVLQLLR
ncbi:flagellin [Paenibacillus sp. FSL H8-0332]|uniref:flagellin N-terminal helical domain-containing protein n=1 Tax=Paenibacillus sp. FSL H8-0332 TaxID=2954742 RepID=UPI0030CA8E14